MTHNICKSLSRIGKNSKSFFSFWQIQELKILFYLTKPQSYTNTPHLSLKHNWTLIEHAVIPSTKLLKIVWWCLLKSLGWYSIKISKRNRMSYFRIFMHIDARELSPPLTFCLIIEYPPYRGYPIRLYHLVISWHTLECNNWFWVQQHKSVRGVFYYKTKC